MLFVVTFEIDWAVYHHHLELPFWIQAGSADAGRQVLIAIAAAVLTVIGVVFSITILALTLASQQFGPRMMRNFVRDIGNQVSLGVFVATFVYSVLSLRSITSAPPTRLGPFVPRLSITTAEALLLVDLAVLIYIIHHIARSIQLPEVIAGIARDLMRSIDVEFPEVGTAPNPLSSTGNGKSVAELVQLIDDRGGVVHADASGYLQFVGYAQLVEIASRTDAVIRLNHRPGHFIVAGRPLATVWPGGASGQVALALAKAHVTGPHRTLMKDPVFAIDQLVEIGIRALSPAVNDTFTALTCIDWLAAGLSRVSGRTLEEGVYRDRFGRVRLIESCTNGEPRVRQGASSVTGNARGHHPNDGCVDEHHGADHFRRTETDLGSSGRDDLRERPRERARCERPGGHWREIPAPPQPNGPRSHRGHVTARAIGQVWPRESGSAWPSMPRPKFVVGDDPIQVRGAMSRPSASDRMDRAVVVPRHATQLRPTP